MLRFEQEEVEKKAIEEFYKPGEPEYQEEDATQARGEVMNFDSLINDDEDDYYIGEESERDPGHLNPISEDAQEESVSPHPKDKS